ncbi:uncharacterized protein [Nicotiana sylvestris]|uniref:Uncharacterized protein LOC104232601 n=1 Tax=Nicotiana sylvestris TaxID=4096 RepID=A0A1U7XCG6_NICSY|nr:PREDICTED: uncharacterized protein LOC104232601 [Nicotiana sylvestris]
MKLLEELTKRVESGEKKNEANDKKMETYNSRVNQIGGAPLILKELDSKKFIQKPFPSRAAPKLIPKRFDMPDTPKHNGTTDPNDHMTSYTCAIKGNDLEDDENKSVLLKKFGETLSKRAMIWYHNLPPNYIDSFDMLADAFVKSYAEAIKVETRKSDLFKAFTQGLNPRSSLASQQLKQNLVEYPAVTWDDVHNRYQSKIWVKEDQLGAPSGSVYPIRADDRSKRAIDQETRPVRDRYQPYSTDRIGNRSGHHPARNEKRSDRGPGGHGLMSKNWFNRPLESKEAPRLSEYNFNMDVSNIVSAVGRIKETRWPRPLQFDPTQREPNLMCKYHGTHGHKTEDCLQLREEFAQLFNNGHLRE